MTVWTAHPAGPLDADEVRDLVQARADWMCERGLDGAEDWREFASEYARQTAEDYPVWALRHPDGRLAAVTTLYERAPDWLWPADDPQIPEFYVASTATHPAWAGTGLGTVLLDWVVDRAARTGRVRVRRAAMVEQLVRYYRDTQGWDLERVVPFPGFPDVIYYGFARAAARQPLLPVRTAAGAGV